MSPREVFAAALRPTTFLALLLATACNMTKDEPDAASVVKSPVPHPPQTFLVPGHTALPIDLPEPELPELDYAKLTPPTWELTPTKPMRLANYRVPRAEGDKEDGEVSVAVAGGDVESNVQRWIKQFDGTPEVKRNAASLKSVKLTHVEIVGTYAPGGMGPDKPPGKPDTTVRGEIIDLGSVGFFVKFVGPTNTVKASREAYDKFLLDVITSLVGVAPSE